MCFFNATLIKKNMYEFQFGYQNNHFATDGDNREYKRCM